MEIVFARTRYDYPSYTDYWKLVELCGFEICWVDHIDFERECVYILSPLTGEYIPFRDSKRGGHYFCKIVMWCLERPSGTNGLGNFRKRAQQLLDEWYFDEIWLSDRHLLSHMHDERTRYVTLGSHKGLGTLDRLPVKNDIVHLSYLTGRRSAVYSAMKKEGVRVADNCWADTRHQTLMSTKLMVNVHQDGWGILEPLRFALGAAYGLPILTEECDDSYPYNRRGGEHNVIECPYDKLTEKAVELTKTRQEEMVAMGRRCHEMMTTMLRFDKPVIEAVQEMPDTGYIRIV